MTEVGVLALSRLLALREISIGNAWRNKNIFTNRVGDEGAAYLTSLQQLVRLSIGTSRLTRDNCGIALEGVESISKLPSLRSLQIRTQTET